MAVVPLSEMITVRGAVVHASSSPVMPEWVKVESPMRRGRDGARIGGGTLGHSDGGPISTQLLMVL